MKSSLKVDLNMDDIAQYRIRFNDAFSSLVMMENVTTFVKIMKNLFRSIISRINTIEIGNSQIRNKIKIASNAFEVLSVPSVAVLSIRCLLRTDLSLIKIEIVTRINIMHGMICETMAAFAYAHLSELFVRWPYWIGK